jgi:hypothetical protein
LPGKNSICVVLENLKPKKICPLVQVPQLHQIPIFGSLNPRDLRHFCISHHAFALSRRVNQRAKLVLPHAWDKDFCKLANGDSVKCCETSWIFSVKFYLRLFAVMALTLITACGVDDIAKVAVKQAAVQATKKAVEEAQKKIDEKVAKAPKRIAPFSQCFRNVSKDCSSAELSQRDMSDLDLSNTVFDKADLSGADLSRSDLRGSSFVGSDLTGADLTGALIDGVNLQLAKLTGAKMPDGTIHD